METITKEILDKIYTKRPENSRKYDFGYLLVIGGSEFYTGAPALAAMAAEAAGVDLVRVAAPGRANDIIDSFSPTLLTLPLEGKRFCMDNYSCIMEAIATMKAVAGGKCAAVIGNGIGRSQDTMEAVKEFVANADIPIVADADAMYALANNLESLGNEKLLLTPHAREFYVLTGNKVDDKTDEQKIDLVTDMARSLKVTLMLKGKIDIISNGERTVCGTSGNALMTRGGTGDTLAGIAGAIAARGHSLFDAACAAAFINGKAGELAGEEKGESMTAVDLINEIHNVLPRHKY